MPSVLDAILSARFPHQLIANAISEVSYGTCDAQAIYARSA